jgi:hypothetical protein
VNALGNLHNQADEVSLDSTLTRFDFSRLIRPSRVPVYNATTTCALAMDGPMFQQWLSAPTSGGHTLDQNFDLADLNTFDPEVFDIDAVLLGAF